MTRIELIEKFQSEVLNNWESLDKEQFIVDLLKTLPDTYVFRALNLAGDDGKALLAPYLKERGFGEHDFD